MVNEMVSLFNAGHWDQLEVKARHMSQRHPAHQLGWSALGKAQLKLGKLPEAMTALSRLARLVPGDADAHNDLGNVLYRLGRLDDAEASFRRALAIKPEFAEAHSNLGTLQRDRLQLDEAVASHQRSLQINPGIPETHNSLGNALRDLNRLADAETCYRNALLLAPQHFEASLNLGLVMNDLGRFEEAQACFTKALSVQPNSAVALHSLGSLLARFGGQDEVAQQCLEKAIALDPKSVEAHIALGNLFLRQGRIEASQARFLAAQRLQPVVTWPAKQAQPDFSALLLDAPGAGSTPVDYLAGRASYDRHFYGLLPDSTPDLALLQSKGDVVINMIADADNGQDILPQALALVDSLGLPTVNHPRLVMATDRASIARRIAGIPLVRVPRTERLPGAVLMGAATNGCLDGFTLPVLVRLAGNHGGDEFEKFDDVPALCAFVSRHPEGTFYLSEYVDYRSADGFFRKYRVICLNGEVLPYHLAIHSDWMVHHFRTDMANQAWMRAEEESFLREPQGVFDEAHQQALKAIASTIGLDYCGIDCALDREGRIVVFEANAAMLVHDEKNETFAYKNPYIAKIKDAFDLMVSRKAGRA
jgi:tetratricopeptide (TPR) repeat protein